MRARVQKRSSIVDQHGRPYVSTGYISSDSMRRSMRGWNPSAGSADSDTIPHLESLRASSRDLMMNTPLGSGALSRYLTNVVGYGLSYESRIDREVLGLSVEQAKRWQRQAEREFRLWSDSPECSADRSCDFYDLQALTYLSKLASGDVFVMFPWIPRKSVPYDVRVKVLEADMVSNPMGYIDTETLAGGIEVDSNGAPIRYHISTRHPGSTFSLSGRRWVPVSAYSPRTGQRQVYHIFDKLRPGQRRGIPLLAPVIESLKMISRLSEAELMASVVASFFTVFVKTKTGEPLGEGFSADISTTDETQRTDDANLYELGSGSVVDLAENEEIEVADPKRPNDSYDPFFQAMSKQVGAAIGQPFEVMIQHFSSSYSAARASLLEAWKSFMTHRTVTVVRKFCQPSLERVLTEAVIKGRIEAPGFLDNAAIRKAWCGAKWNGPGQGMLRPDVETKAAVARIESHLSTRSKEVAAIDGDDWDRLEDRHEYEERRLQETAPAQTDEESNG